MNVPIPAAYARGAAAAGAVACLLGTTVFLLFKVSDLADGWHSDVTLAFGAPILLVASVGSLLWLFGVWQERAQTSSSRRRRAFIWPVVALVVVGYFQLVASTCWKGEPWVRQASGTTLPLYAIRGTPSGSQLWIAGYKGTLLNSVDRGGTWRRAEPGVDFSLLAVDVSDDGRRVWVGGEGGLLSSRDYGATWTLVARAAHASAGAMPDPGERRPLRACIMGGAALRTAGVPGEWPRGSGGEIGFSDAWSDPSGETLWLVGGLGLAWQSVDGGRTWAQRDTGTTAPVSSVFGTESANHVWITGHMTMLHFGNYGGTIEEQCISGWPLAIHGTPDGRNLWAVGDLGTTRNRSRVSGGI